jgi:diaminopimelate decarboxylase
MLIVRVLYVKRQAGQTFLITDGSMAELIRPALYEAHHEIVPVKILSQPSPYIERENPAEGRKTMTTRANPPSSGRCARPPTC